jgi:hypothetical protein
MKRLNNLNDGVTRTQKANLQNDMRLVRQVHTDVNGDRENYNNHKIKLN